MSRLDLMIERLQAQRLCIDWAVDRIQGIDGVVLELGLGSGRTYDHLRERLPRRRIHVFDLAVEAHPSCVPDPIDLILGDLLDTLPDFVRSFDAPVALVHADVGTADHATNRSIAASLAPCIPRLLVPGGLLLSNRRELGAGDLLSLEPPEGAGAGHCFLFERPQDD